MSPRLISATPSEIYIQVDVRVRVCAISLIKIQSMRPDIHWMGIASPIIQKGLQGDEDAGQDIIASHLIASHLMLSPLSESPLLGADTVPTGDIRPCTRRRASDNTNNNNNNNSNSNMQTQMRETRWQKRY